MGDSFFEVDAAGNCNSAWNLFWNDPETRRRYAAKKPFQVFSYWNGATAFAAAPLLDRLRFGGVREGECFQGEPQLFCKDLWAQGHGKIAVVPTVNLEYSDERGADIKKLRGYVSGEVGDGIEWMVDPPRDVRCMPDWGRQDLAALE